MFISWLLATVIFYASPFGVSLYIFSFFLFLAFFFVLYQIKIPPVYNLYRASASSLALNTRQCMHLPEIPPFRKKSTDSAEHTGSSASSSPQRTIAISSNLINASASVSASRQQLPLQLAPLAASAATPPPGTAAAVVAASAIALSATSSSQPQLQQLPLKQLPLISKISDIPPFNARKISAESTMNLNISVRHTIFYFNGFFLLFSFLFHQNFPLI